MEQRSFDVKGYTNAWNTHNTDRLLEMYARDAEIIALPNPAPYKGREGIRKNIADTLKGIPDVNGDVAWSVQQGNKVAALIHVSGRQTGPLELSPEQIVPPSGNKVAFELGVFLELDNEGKIKKETQVPDSATLLMQVGVLGEGAKSESRPAPRRA